MPATPTYHRSAFIPGKPGQTDKENTMSDKSSNTVRWFEIYVQDMDRARKFYETVLQVKLAKLDSPTQAEFWSFPQMQMDRAGTSGALVKMKGVPSGGMGTLVYFACEDCAVEAGRVAKAGGKVKDEKHSIGQYGAIALAFDTEGNLFGLHSMK
jgi:predicted enzyme related to lactoylglutathione lyase